MVYKVTYFAIRGLAEEIRLLLHDNNLQFNDCKVSADEWAKIKPTMQFGQVPCLQDGDFQLVQTGAIMRYLGRKHHLYATDPKDIAYLDMVYSGVKDMRMKYTRLIYEDYDTKKDDFIANTIPPWLDSFEKLLKGHSSGNAFIAGDKITFADYALFEMLNCLVTLDPNCLNKFPALKGYHKRMTERPNLKKYLEERKNLPINNNGKQ